MTQMFKLADKDFKAASLCVYILYINMCIYIHTHTYSKILNENIYTMNEHIGYNHPEIRYYEKRIK